jgi:hypothetical protein
MSISPLRTLPVQRTPLRELNLDMLLGAPALALPMQEGSGSIVEDISGFDNNGTITGATWTRLPSGLWCLSFDGTDDYVDCGNDKSLDITGALTIEAWINLTDAVPEQFLYCKGAINAEGIYLTVGDNSGRIHMVTAQAGAAQHTYTPTGCMVAGTWYQVTVVRIGAAVRLYKNAVETPYQSQGTHIDPATSTRTAKIGVYDNLTLSPLDGCIALFRLYNRALSLLEIQNHFNQEKHYFDIFNGNILARLLKQRSLAVVR